MADVTTPINQYKELLLNQYVNLPNARGTIGALAQAALIDLVEIDVQDSFTIDFATGVQLDVLGQYIGFNRNIISPIDRYYFMLRDYGSPAIGEAGFTDYTDNSINAGSANYLYTFANTSFYTLDDQQYRPLLKLKIILNQSQNTLSEIAAALWQFFGSDIICFDNRDMTLTYAISVSAVSLAQIAVQAGLLPKPMGVRITGIFLIPDPAHVFGFEQYEYTNGNVLGFSTYEDGFNGQTWVSYNDRI